MLAMGSMTRQLSCEEPAPIRLGQRIDTIRRFLQACKMNHTDALEQFQKATKFHTEKKAIPLYDLISVDDYEDTRKLVSRMNFENGITAPLDELINLV